MLLDKVRRARQRRANDHPEPLSALAVRAHVWAELREQWKTQLLGSVIVAVGAYLLALLDSGFSREVWHQVTNTVIFPMVAVVLWLILSALWHLWRAPIRLARAAISDHGDHIAGLAYAHSVDVARLEQELADARQTVEKLRAAEQIGPSPFPRTPLERAVARQIAAAEEIERERPVRGDGDYFDAVMKWAGETSESLCAANAGDLAIAFKQGGIQAPLTIEKVGNYMAEKMQLLRDALAQLRSDESATPSKQPRDPVEALRAERRAAEQVRDWLAVLDYPDGKLPLDEDRVYAWADRVFRLLRLSFVEDADRFMGTTLTDLGHRYFATAYYEQIHERGRERYFQDRVTLVDEILRSVTRSR